MADKISLNEWAKYRDTLSKLSDKAADEFKKYFFDANGAKNGTGLADATRQEIIDVAYALVTKYGEASSEVSCQMYDAIAKLQNVNVDSAIPAATATYQETAKAVNGTLKQSPSGQLLDGVVQRLVKQPAADTMLQNAKRDGAEWAWVPSGDTCVFCIMLASRGWQPASKAVLKGNHAEHIHAHCDCQFVVRFDGMNVAGYDPDKYLELYNSAEGYSSDEKIKYLRRIQYQRNKEAINARKRELYNNNKKVDNVISLKDKTASEIDRDGRRIVLKSWEDYRKKYLGNAVSFDESKIDEWNYDFVKLGHYKEKEVVEDIYKTISNLSDKYYSPLQKLQWMDNRESVSSNVFARSSHLYGHGTAEIIFNPIKFTNKGVERLKELSEKGYSVKIQAGREVEYVTTHEFAHTILSIGEKLPSKSQNFVQCDFEPTKKARKELEAIWNSYSEKIQTLQNEYNSFIKPMEEKMIFGLGEVTDEERTLTSNLRKKMEEATISKYSLTNVDEFVAEAFTDAIMNEKPSEYSKEVKKIIDKYFGK